MAEGKPAYREIVLKVIKERPWKDGKGFGCWVIQTVCDNKSVRVQVRSGMYYPNKVTGEKQYPKEGLEISDFRSLKETYKAEIEPMLNIPKGTAVSIATEDAPPPEENIEDVPW